MAYLDRNTGLILPGIAPGGSGGSGGGSGGSGGSVDFYQCAEVFGPSKVSGFIVSGAGTAAVNGNYLPTDLKTEEDTPIYKHETAEYYYFEMWGEKGITTSPTQYPSEGLYYNMYDEGWTVGSGGAEPGPTVTAGNITINTDVPKTWNGYKAVWSDSEGYSFETALTEGLAYGSTLAPRPGGVYDSRVRMEVSKLFETVKPITTNDTACLIYIDGTTLANQALAPNKQEVQFGSEVSVSDGVLISPMTDGGHIFTQCRSDGYGGDLDEWTIDICARCESESCYITGNSGGSWDWCIESTSSNRNWHFRDARQKTLMPRDEDKSKFFCMSIQYQKGIVHVWDSGKYMTELEHLIQPKSERFGIGCDGYGEAGSKANAIKFFRFSNKARYTPGVDFELPEGFL